MSAADAEGPGRADEPPAGPPSGPPVGSVAEEALKLVGALSGWGRVHESHGSTDDRPSEEPRNEASPDAREAQPAPECAWCPLCRAMRTLGLTNPEVREHLAAAGTSLLAAVTAALAPPADIMRDEDEGDPR